MLGRRCPVRQPGSVSRIVLGALAILSANALASAAPAPAKAPAKTNDRWIGTWATAAERPVPAHPDTFHDQTLRLIVRVSAGGAKVRVRISNTFGDAPLVLGAAHAARRTAGAAIDPTSDRRLTFAGQASVSIAPHATIVSDPVELDVPPLSDLAISLFLPETTVATTEHVLAKQTS